MRRAFTVLVVAGVIAGTTTAAAGETSANRHALSPRSGRADTIFTLRYVSQGADTDAGDQLYLYGPQHTGCRGLIVQDSVGDAPGRQVVRFGFKRGDGGSQQRHQGMGFGRVLPASGTFPAYIAGFVPLAVSRSHFARPFIAVVRTRSR
jgi:hypothetical protein